ACEGVVADAVSGEGVVADAVTNEGVIADAVADEGVVADAVADQRRVGGGRRDRGGKSGECDSRDLHDSLPCSNAMAAPSRVWLCRRFCRALSCSGAQ